MRVQEAGIIYSFLIPGLPSGLQTAAAGTTILQIKRQICLLSLHYLLQEMDYEVFCKSTFTDTHTIALSLQ